MIAWISMHQKIDVFIVLHWFLLESSVIQPIPRIPEESNLAEGPAKLIQWFWQNFWMEFKFRQNCSRNDPDRMPPGTRWNGILVESLFVDDAQIEHWQILMLNLGIINKQHHSFSTTTIVHDAYPPCQPPSIRVHCLCWLWYWHIPMNMIPLVNNVRNKTYVYQCLWFKSWTGGTYP